MYVVGRQHSAWPRPPAKILRCWPMAPLIRRRSSRPLGRGVAVCEVGDRLPRVTHHRGPPVNRLEPCTLGYMQSVYIVTEGGLMDKPILVAYATKRGGTSEIAERIGAAIREAGLDVDVVPVDSVRDLGGYGAVVLGSAVYIGQWRKQAVRFLNEHEPALSRLPVWIFSSGPTGKDESEAFMNNTPLPKSVLPLAERIRPQETVIFHGVVDPDRSTWFDRWVIRRVGAPLGDAREWDEIEAWGRRIADVLRG
jgi:menaquinone-dependent protoporphyrinogen oxidase